MNDFFAKLGQSAPAPTPVRNTPAEASMAEPKYTAEVQPNVAPSQEAEAQPEQPAASEVPKEEEAKADAGAADEQAKPDAGDGEVKEATEEEMAAAATKISSVYKGNKDREMVKEMKAARESANADGEGAAAEDGEEA